MSDMESVPVEIRVKLLEDGRQETRANMVKLNEKLDVLEASIQRLTWTIMGALLTLTVGVVLWALSTAGGIPL